MESTNYDQYQDETASQPQRPDFLKILCILSFVACGLMILVCLVGTMALSLDQATVDKTWSKMVESSPQLEDLDPMEFMHNVGMYCIYLLIATVFSLVGVIMMWRLEKLGFFIYAIAELSTHFFRMDMGPAAKDQSYAGLIFGIAIDLVFIGMYMSNLKYMNRKNNNTFIQSGS